MPNADYAGLNSMSPVVRQKCAVVAAVLACLGWLGVYATPSDVAPKRGVDGPDVSTTVPAVIKDVCMKCHSGEHPKAGLDLSTREGLLAGGDSGPAVVPGNSRASLLYQLVAHQREPSMPYNQKKLPDSVILILEEWITRGVPYDSSTKLAAAGALSGPSAPNTAANAAGMEFFEKKIRPVLADHCYTCHKGGLPKVGGGLSLDSRNGMLKGGNSGPALVPGAPEKSLLLRAIRYSDSALQMPPVGKLTDEQIADFESWIKMGAPDPRSDTAQPAPAKSKYDFAKARRFWSFQPPKDPSVPPVKRKDWPQTPIDHFILTKLEEKGISPSRAADKRTLLRRATYDLTGLPPTSEELEAFLADRSPDAFAKIVDRLLASPHYGERWGRYWLDLARYADTKGYVFNEERRYPYSYTYRDWVIRSFNEDLPYDQFIMRQIAADRLPQDDGKGSLAALGFLTLGRRFLNNKHDIIDDRIDVVARTTMALTVSCARCHDHKFDAIPTKDYYALYGIFANSIEPKDPPLLGEPAPTKEYAAYQTELKNREEEIARYLKTTHESLTKALRGRDVLVHYLMAAHDTYELPDDKVSALAQKRDLNLFVLNRWRAYLKKSAQPQDQIFAPWHAFHALSDADLVKQAPQWREQWSGNGDPGKPLNVRVAQAFIQDTPATMRAVAERYAELLVAVDSLKPLDDPAQEDLRRVLHSPEAPVNVSLQDVDKLMNRAERDKLTQLRKKLDELKVTHPGAPARAMILEDVPNPSPSRVLIRGNPNNPGDLVPPQFLTLLSPEPRRPVTKGSGRLELARAIASADNPLTARVLVNRIWAHHFGNGLVRTPSDFGSRSEPPTHPELLDFLARQFIKDGWSLKKLHRLIMLSSVYQQSSGDDAKSRAMDPENRLLWRMNRRRLDFEALRDSLLAVTGSLDTTMGGRPISLMVSPFSRRRTVYGFIDRQNLPSVFRTFDFASPDTHSPQRFTTSVPQQALFIMNSPFVMEQARHLAQCSDVRKASTDEQRLQKLYRRVFQRKAKPEEVTMGLQFVAASELESEAGLTTPAVWQYGMGQYDETGRRMKNFRAFTHYTGDAWQDGPRVPDPKSGPARLTATGGHPGPGSSEGVVRRWIAPRDGIVDLNGKLVHKQKEGDGIQARVVSSRRGELAAWTVYRSEAETRIEGIEVKAGDTIDFYVDARQDAQSDLFQWAPIIRLKSSISGAAEPVDVVEWNAAQDFNGDNGQRPSPLTAWEKFAQVLLATNEFIFVD